MSQLKDADIKNMKPGSKSKVESLGKSRGALVFRKVSDYYNGLLPLLERQAIHIT